VNRDRAAARLRTSKNAQRFTCARDILRQTKFIGRRAQPQRQSADRVFPTPTISGARRSIACIAMASASGAIPRNALRACQYFVVLIENCRGPFVTIVNVRCSTWSLRVATIAVVRNDVCAQRNVTRRHAWLNRRRQCFVSAVLVEDIRAGAFSMSTHKKCRGGGSAYAHRRGASSCIMRYTTFPTRQSHNAICDSDCRRFATIKICVCPRDTCLGGWCLDRWVG
jgi:hypothetical protein